MSGRWEEGELPFGDDRPGLSGRDDNDTQRAAAAHSAGGSGTRRRMVCEVVRGEEGRGVTDWELEQILHRIDPRRRWLYGDYAPRRRELANGGFIVDSGERRPSPETGQMMVVWKAAEFADEEALP